MVTVTSHDIAYLHSVLCIISANPDLPSPMGADVTADDDATYFEELRKERAKQYIANQRLERELVSKQPMLPKMELLGVPADSKSFPDWFYIDRRRRAIWIGTIMALHDVRLIDIARHAKLTNKQISEDLDYMVELLRTTYTRENSSIYIVKTTQNWAIYQIRSQGELLYSYNIPSTFLKRYAKELEDRSIDPLQHFQMR